MDKLEISRLMVKDLLGRYSRPCVLWSGGKDSMVLLHLVRMVRPEVEVVCWREPWMPGKQKFANRIIEEWNLTAWDWHPEAISLCKGLGRIDVLNYYSFGAHPMMLARGTERPKEGEPYLCGRETFLARPRGKFAIPFGLAFHGHKNCDADACSGAVPLETDLMDTPGMVACAFPLRYWSDDEVFEYSEIFHVPIDEDRYRKAAGKWEILPYQDRTPDYYPACFKCLDPDEGEFVFCPKLQLQINNVSGFVSWEKPSLPYCNLRRGAEHPSTIIPQPSTS